MKKAFQQGLRPIPLLIALGPVLVFILVTRWLVPDEPQDLDQLLALLPRLAVLGAIASFLYILAEGFIVAHAAGRRPAYKPLTLAAVLVAAVTLVVMVPFLLFPEHAILIAILFLPGIYFAVALFPYAGACALGAGPVAGLSVAWNATRDRRLGLFGILFVLGLLSGIIERVFSKAPWPVPTALADLFVIPVSAILAYRLLHEPVAKPAPVPIDPEIEETEPSAEPPEPVAPPARLVLARPGIDEARFVESGDFEGRAWVRVGSDPEAWMAAFAAGAERIVVAADDLDEATVLVEEDHLAVLGDAPAGVASLGGAGGLRYVRQGDAWVLD